MKSLLKTHIDYGFEVHFHELFQKRVYIFWKKYILKSSIRLTNNAPPPINRYFRPRGTSTEETVYNDLLVAMLEYWKRKQDSEKRVGEIFLTAPYWFKKPYPLSVMFPSFA